MSRDGRVELVHERPGLTHVYVHHHDEEGEKARSYAGSVEQSGKFKAAHSGPPLTDAEAHKAESAHAAQGKGPAPASGSTSPADAQKHSENHKAMKSAEAAGKRAVAKGDHAQAAANFGAAAKFATEASKSTPLEAHKKVYEAVSKEHEARASLHSAKAWAGAKSGGGGGSGDDRARDDKGQFASK